MAIKAAFASLLRALVDILDDRDPKHVTELVEEIKNNHLFHLNAEVIQLSARLGSLEGRLGLVISLLMGIIMIGLGGIVSTLLATR